MKPTCLFLFAALAFIAVGCSELDERSTKIEPGNKVVQYNVEGMS